MRYFHPSTAVFYQKTMNRRTTIIAITAIALMLSGIVFAVSRLYGTDKPAAAGRQAAESGEWSLLRAVPSDAAVIFCFDGSRQSRRVVADSTGILQAFLAPENRAVMDFLSFCSGNRTV